MQNKIFITGHKNPDTDSICSAIAYGEFKSHFNVNAIPVRIGKINRETTFVLEYFNVQEPEYLLTVKAQISDLNMEVVEPVMSGITLKEAWHKLKTNNYKVLPVKDSDEKFIGVVSVSDIASAYINVSDNNLLSASHTSFENIVKTLDAKLIFCPEGKVFNPGKVLIAAMDAEHVEEYTEEGDIVIVGNRKDSQKKAINAGGSCIVTCGSEVDKDVIDLAKEKGYPLMVTEYDTFTVARLIFQSIPISYNMTFKGIVCFHIDDYVNAAKEKMLQTRFRSYPVLDNDSNFIGFISRYHLIDHNRKKVILVDHSEKSQTVNGIEDADILEIIDHHRIGDIQTNSPIYYRNEAVGSTATIIANLFFQNGIVPSKKIAGIMCAAILSDTVKFQSPTSTNSDFEIATRLAEISNIDIEDFSRKMFEAGSSLKNMTINEIVSQDFKEYVIGKYKIGIGQVNITDVKYIKKLKDSILKHLNFLLESKGYNMVLLIIVDVINEMTEVLFVETQKGFMTRAFGPIQEEDCFSTKGILSRKKQILPQITRTLQM